MPKLKTHKPAKRRFTVTGSGKIMRMKGGKSHLRRNKSKRAKQAYDAKLPLHPSFKTKIKKLLPYS
jgi:large subunit ribosomal protein L35